MFHANFSRIKRIIVFCSKVVQRSGASQKIFLNFTFHNFQTKHEQTLNLWDVSSGQTNRKEGTAPYEILKYTSQKRGQKRSFGGVQLQRPDFEAVSARRGHHGDDRL